MSTRTLAIVPRIVGRFAPAAWKWGGSEHRIGAEDAHRARLLHQRRDRLGDDPVVGRALEIAEEHVPAELLAQLGPIGLRVFGGHRGGLQNADQLINKESDSLLVEFDFSLGSETYRIKRTLKRSSRSTRQLLHKQGVNGQDRWEPVENTGAARGFEEWVKEHIGLNYETFTSSVLLMQGRADKLINADHNERRKVLAGIVDLERYEKLHKRVDELRKTHKDLAEEVQFHREMAGIALSFRNYSLEKPPSVSEMIDFAKALQMLGTNHVTEGHRDVLLPFLAKTEKDRRHLLLREGFKSLLDDGARIAERMARRGESAE